MNFMQLKTIVAAAAMLVGSAIAAQAVTCPTPGTVGVVRYLDLVSTPAATCLASGTEPNADGAFQTAHSQYDLIAKEEDGNDGLDGMVDGLVYSGGGYGLSGSFDFTPVTGHDDFVLLFKLGHPHTSDSWFAFTIPSSVFSADWNVEDALGVQWTGAGALSHVTLYGIPTPVPVPAAGLLLLGGLGGFAFLRRRRKTA